VLAPLALTLILLIFAEAAPKTLAALYPERVGLPAAFIYWPLQKLLYPVLVLVNLLSNSLLRLFGVSPEDAAQHSLSAEELRSVVAEAGAMIPQRHQRMLLSILDLERATVEDIMIPRNEIIGIDISEPWERTLEVITGSSHTRLPVFDGSIDELKGVVHLRKLVRLAAQGELRQDTLLQLVRDPYFIPEGTPLNQQLLNFQDQKRRIGFVVDEYGDIQGLVTLEDILEEVVGEFTSDPATRVKNVYLDADGSVLVQNVKFSFPAELSAPALDIPALKLLGTIDGQLTEGRVVGGWINGARGNARWRDAGVIGEAEARFGDVLSEFASAPDGSIAGTVKDNGTSSLVVDGQFVVRSGEFDATVRLGARAEDVQLREALRYIGEPQPDGTSLLKIHGQLLKLF